jgi:hypothetical protein
LRDQAAKQDRSISKVLEGIWQRQAATVASLTAGALPDELHVLALAHKGARPS